MAKVHPYDLPTGEQLMSTPIVSGGLTRREKEIEFLQTNIQNRLTSLEEDESFETYKVFLFMFGVLSACVGVTLILFGLHLTPIFEKFQDDNIPALVFGGIFLIPLFLWFVFMFLPGRKERFKRKRIHRARRERRKPTLFNDMVNDAKRAAEPPPRKIKTLAHVRKHDYPIVASTWKEFCEALENATGLPIERQLVRHKDEDLHIDLAMKMDEPPYNLNNGDRLHVYNRGGFFTTDTPIKRQLREIEERNRLEALAYKRAAAPVEEKSNFQRMRESFRPKDDDDEDAPAKSGFGRQSMPNGGGKKSMSENNKSSFAESKAGERMSSFSNGNNSFSEGGGGGRNKSMNVSFG